MKLLILGASGMLGHKLVIELGRDFDVVGTLRSDPPQFYTTHSGTYRLQPGIDAADTHSLERLISDYRPDYVINCIGIVKQLAVAKDPISLISINALFPHQLARLCTQQGIRLIHFSTDCVFSGRQGPYDEDSVSDAEDLYGRSKFLGEVSRLGVLTIRTSIIGREIIAPTGLLEWFLAQRGRTVRGFTKALFTGLTTDAMAGVVRKIILEQPELSGLYQVSTDPISKYDLLVLFNQHIGHTVTIEKEIEFSCDRRLLGSRFRQQTGWQPQPWPELIERMFIQDRRLYGEGAVLSNCRV